MALSGAVRNGWRGDAVCDQSSLAFEYYKSYQSYVEAFAGKKNNSSRKDLGSESQIDSEVLFMAEKFDRLVPPVWCGYSAGVCGQLRSSSAVVRGALCDARDIVSREFSGEIDSFEEGVGANGGCDTQSTLEFVQGNDSGELLRKLHDSGAGKGKILHGTGLFSDVRQKPINELSSRVSDSSTHGLNNDSVVYEDVILSEKSSDAVIDENRLVKGQPGFWKQQRKDKKQRKLQCFGKFKGNQSDVVRVVCDDKTAKLDSIKRKKNWRRSDIDVEACFSRSSDKEDLDLKASLRRKWMAENELAALKAERAIEVAKQVDLADQVKRATTSLKLQTERNMVGIEKTHATLRATGNVPGVVGSVETILDSTISPDSSASMQEFRRVQKENLDLLNKIERMEKRFGVDSNDLDFLDKKTYTDTSENHEKLLKYIPGDFGIIPVGEGDDGKNYFKVEVFGGDVF